MNTGRAGRDRLRTPRTSSDDRPAGDSTSLTALSEQGLDVATRTLEAYLEASVRQLTPDSATHRNGLVVLSAWQESMPALVHLDPVLEPVDSRVFAVLWLWAKGKGQGTKAFPSYEYLLQRCNVQARPTLARSLAILRITRWVTLCRRLRSASGRNAGNVYALHEEPLALATTLYLDPKYMDFLHNALCHHHAHVCEVAQAMLESLQERIQAGDDVLADSGIVQTEQRVEAMATITGQNSGDYFGFRRSALSRLQAWCRRLPCTAPFADRSADTKVQNMNSGARVEKSNSGVRSSCSSSNYINKTTTTGSQEVLTRESAQKTIILTLIYPNSLSRNEQRLGAMYLNGIEPELQQALLDELSEKIRTYAKTDHRVRNPIALLGWMCKEARAGRPPLTSAYLRCRGERDRANALKERLEAEERRLTEQAVKDPSVRAFLAKRGLSMN